MNIKNKENRPRSLTISGIKPAQEFLLGKFSLEEQKNFICQRITESIDLEKTVHLKNFHGLIKTEKMQVRDKNTPDDDVDLTTQAINLYKKIEESITSEIIIDHLYDVKIDDSIRLEIIKFYRNENLPLFEVDTKTELLNKIKDKIRGLESL